MRIVSLSRASALAIAIAVTVLGFAPLIDAAEPAGAAAATSAKGITLVVMDPLAKPLSCPCVEGYAQRDYDRLGAALEKSLGRKVKVVYNDSLKGAMRKEAAGGADIVIGKESVVLHDAKQVSAKFAKVAMLSGKDGLTTQTGLIVVPTADSAKTVADLAGYRMFFGPAECDEKNAAALALLKKHQVAVPETLETAVACDEGANKILELAAKGVRGFAVISSYAKPLLEGCGQVKKGDLRIVAETEPVPFITAFINASLDSADQQALTTALREATNDAALRIALETKSGFVAVDSKGKSSSKSETTEKVSAGRDSDAVKKK
jgi:ABC-type phosphate/phosphonate transport system substrate-binding protein